MSVATKFLNEDKPIGRQIWFFLEGFGRLGIVA